MYMSLEIQNQSINIYSDMIREKTVPRVTEEKKLYLIIVDATTDVGGTKQLSISIPYLCYDNNQIDMKENFIGFIPVVDNSAGVPEHITNYLRLAGLDLDYL